MEGEYWCYYSPPILPNFWQDQYTNSYANLCCKLWHIIASRWKLFWSKSRARKIPNLLILLTLLLANWVRLSGLIGVILHLILDTTPHLPWQGGLPFYLKRRAGLVENFKTKRKSDHHWIIWSGLSSTLILDTLHPTLARGGAITHILPKESVAILQNFVDQNHPVKKKIT